jgi:hypothetical protein
MNDSKMLFGSLFSLWEPSFVQSCDNFTRISICVCSYLYYQKYWQSYSRLDLLTINFIDTMQGGRAEKEEAITETVESRVVSFCVHSCLWAKTSSTLFQTSSIFAVGSESKHNGL